MPKNLRKNIKEAATHAKTSCTKNAASEVADMAVKYNIAQRQSKEAANKVANEGSKKVQVMNDCLEKEEGNIDYKLISYAFELLFNTLLRLGSGKINVTVANILLTSVNVLLETVNASHK